MSNDYQHMILLYVYTYSYRICLGTVKAVYKRSWQLLSIQKGGAGQKLSGQYPALSVAGKLAAEETE
jgi:hypothetical protein